MKPIQTNAKPEGKIIVICSETKGAGKTWLSLELCRALAMLQKRVLLFDANGGLENAAWQTGATAACSFQDVLSGKTTLNNALTTFDKGHFDMIAAPCGENALCTAPLGRLQLLAEDLSMLAKFYDYVIIDTDCTHEKTEKLFLRQSTGVILLTTPDSDALVEAYKQMEFLKKAGYHQVNVVINKVYSANEGKQIFKTVIDSAAELIGIKTSLTGTVSRDARVKESISSRELVSERYPDCESVHDVLKIAQILCKEAPSVTF